MNADRIVIRRTEPNGGYYTVECDNRISTYLCWGEMIEQVISLTHTEISGPRYHARTVEEEFAEEQRRKVQFPRVYTCNTCQKTGTSPINACDRSDCEQIPF